MSRYKFAFYTLLLILLLDPVFYILGELGIIKIPVTSLALFVSGPLVVFYSFTKRSGVNLMIRLILIALVLTVFLASLISNHVVDLIIINWIFRLLCFFVLVRSASVYLCSKEYSNFISWIILLCSSAYLCVLLFVDISDILKNTESNYLRVSEASSVLAICLVAHERILWRKGLLVVLCSLILLLLLSRSSFFFFLVTVILYQSITLMRNRRIVLVILLNIVLICLAISFKDMDNAVLYRFQRLVSNDTVDSSLMERLTTFFEGLQIIREHPILGKYNWQIEKYGEFGYYIHNIFSYAAQFGLFAFLLAFLAILYPIYVIWSRYAVISPVIAEIAVLLSIFVLLNCLFSKSFVYVYIVFPIALVDGIIEKGKLRTS